MMSPNFEEISRFHSEGLSRVASVIEGNPEYDELMTHRLTVDNTDQLFAAENIAEKRSRALRTLHKTVGAARQLVYFPEFRGFCCDGNTKNNLREFSFFDELCTPIGVSVMNHNYAMLPRIGLGSLSSDQKALREKILRDLDAFYGSAEIITASLVHQHAIYSRSFLTGVFSFSYRGSLRPSALVTANDHSPARVATSMVMKGLGVPRIYLQHAEVTQTFPPLDFEYSVLRNQKSSQTYQALGSINADSIYVIPREAEQFSPGELSRKRSLPVTVVIYPTSRILVDALQQLVAVLSNNPQVKKVVIKEHPGAAGTGIGSLVHFKNVELSKTIPDVEHVAIVGNSSVALELLHRGIPVYHDFSLDPVASDYYGLVRSGITQEISTRDAAGHFWRPYDVNEVWLEAYQLLNPTASASAAADRNRFLSRMKQLKAKPIVAASPSGIRLKGRWKANLKGVGVRKLVSLVNAHPRVPSLLASRLLRLSRHTADAMAMWTDRVGRFLLANTDIRIDGDVWRKPKSRATPDREFSEKIDQDSFILATLLSAHDPMAWLADNERLEVVPLSKVIGAMETALEVKERVVIGLLATVSEATSQDSVSARWLLLKKCEIEPLSLSENMLDRLLEFTLAFDGEPLVRAKLEASLLSAVLRFGHARHFKHLWSDGKTLFLENLALKQQQQVSEFLASATTSRDIQDSDVDTSTSAGGRQ